MSTIYIDGLKEVVSTPTSGVVNGKNKGNPSVELSANDSIILKNVEYAGGGYNFIEIPAWKNPNNNDLCSLNKVKISDVTHTGALSHNGISIYSFKEGAEVVIENVDFQNMGAGNGDGQFLRLSNLKRASNVTITVKNCHMTNTYYGSNGNYDELWATFGFAQDDFSTDSVVEDYSGFKLNFINCTYNGDPVLLENKNVFTIWRSKSKSYVKAGEAGAPQITTSFNLPQETMDALKARYNALCEATGVTKASNPNIQ